MGIETAIHQIRHFRSEHHKVIVNILFTGGWMQEQVRAFLEQADITHQQYNILRMLRGSNTPMTTMQIRERMLDKMSDTSRIVDRLILKELVTKSINKHDKRLVDVSITKKGRAVLEKLDEQNEKLDAITHRLTEEEAKMLNNLLDIMRGD